MMVDQIPDFFNKLQTIHPWHEEINEDQLVWLAAALSQLAFHLLQSKHSIKSLIYLR